MQPKEEIILKIASIASGSNGNCYYLENDNDAILVDAGISAKQIIERMTNLGLSMSKVRAVFISTSIQTMSEALMFFPENILFLSS
jgi:glyoxylase-like metal-dependent hydrolase (beta-lactamase superfamily II)